MSNNDDGHEWSKGCPDCAHLREELAEALDTATHFRNELAQLRKDMRVAVVGYEARLREEVARYQTLLAMIETVHLSALGTLPPDTPPEG